MMNKQIKKEMHRNKLVRSLCVICVTVFLLTACIGCTPHATADEVASLKSQLNDAVRQISLLQVDSETAQLELEALKNSNEMAQMELDTLKSANKAAKQEIDALKSANQSAKQEIDALKDSNQTAKQEIDALKSSNQSAKQEIEALKSSNQAAQQEINTLKSNNQAAQQEIEALKSQYEAAQQEIDRLKKQLQDLQENVTPDEPIEPTEKIKIYIDQGHNPTSHHNTGASGNGLYEQDLTFAIGSLLAQLLEEDGRFEICLSRPTADTVLGTDNPSSLEARVQGATEFGADYFISLHINSFDAESANGIEVFVAEQEGASYDFGNSLLQGLIDSTGLRNRGMQLGPNLYVLANATMPAALLEMGFISNTTDSALLSESPELFAQGIYDGILAYFDLTATDASVN